MRPLICHFNRDPHTLYLMGQSPAELQRLHVVVTVFKLQQSAHESQAGT